MYADPAQPLTTAGEEIDDLDNDLSDLSVRGVKHFSKVVCPRHVSVRQVESKLVAKKGLPGNVRVSKETLGEE